MKSILIIAVLSFANFSFADAATDRKQHLNEMIARVNAACGSDFQKFCPAAQEYEKGRCLHENKDKLSASCKALVANMPAPPPASH